jgi:DNA-binding GntR family transcriptional regulator
VVVIDPTSDTPVYRQLAGILRSGIERGEYQAGQLLPSEGRLAQIHGVGRETVRQALAILRAEGAIVTVRGFGSYVRGPSEEITVVHIEMGARVTARMPKYAERRALGLHEGVPLLVVSRVGRDDEVYPADRTAIEVRPG